MDILIKVAQLIVCLSILVIIHEFGHFIFAKMFGARVEKFYLFFNPWFSLFKRKIGETEYGIGWVPFGGYVKISGMIDESMDKEAMKQEPKSYEFRSKKAWQRLLIMVGGVLMNLLLAFAIYTGMSYHYGESYIANKDVKDGYQFSELAQEIGFINGDKIVSINGEQYESYFDILQAVIFEGESEVVVERAGNLFTVSVDKKHVSRMLKDGSLITLRVPFNVDSVAPSSAAQIAGIVKGDSLVAVDSIEKRYRDEFIEVFKSRAGDTISLTVIRNQEPVILTLAIPDSSIIGTYSATNPALYYPVTEKKFTILESFPQGFKRAGAQIDNYFKQLGLIFSPETEAYKSVGSVIAMGSFFPAEWDWFRFWNITALFSIMLAVLNILPIPALDGGHVVFLLYEVITRRKPSDKFMEVAQTIGMILLFGLIIITMGNDIIKLFMK